MSKLTPGQAAAAFGYITRHYKLLGDSFGTPTLVEDWEKTYDSIEPVMPWAVVWHDGPLNWAIDASHDGVVPREIAFAEPGNGQVLGLYPPQ
jgi:hypothetical protein